MDRLTIEQRVKIIKTYYKSGESNITTFRAIRSDYGRHNRPTPQAIGKIVKKFEASGSVTDVVRPVHHRNIRSVKNIAAVSASVQNEPNQSIARRSQELGISQSTLWRILHRDLDMHEKLNESKITDEHRPETKQLRQDAIAMKERRLTKKRIAGSN